jgi:hypothetical protein
MDMQQRGLKTAALSDYQNAAELTFQPNFAQASSAAGSIDVVACQGVCSSVLGSH